MQVKGAACIEEAVFTSLQRMKKKKRRRRMGDEFLYEVFVVPFNYV